MRQINVTNSFLVISLLTTIQATVCPDERSQCKDGMTCCKWSSGTYGCCPLDSAQCCADGLHCCPRGTKCNDREGSCDQIRSESHAIQTMPQMGQLCPDKNKTCSQLQTCCRLRTGGYGCCFYSSAVCCEDMLHCCPHGTRCDIVHRQCVRPSTQSDNNSNDLKLKMRLIAPIPNATADMVCPGGQYTCPDGNTCCRMGDTQWGCCPLNNAVCCDDGKHCCPNGYKCTPDDCQAL